MDSDKANANQTRTKGALQRLATPAGSPSKTQQERVAETPQPSLDTDKSAGAPGKRAAPLASPHVSPQRPTRSSGEAAVLTTAAADNEGATDVGKEAQPQDATDAGGPGPSSGDKRPREDEAGGEGGSAPPQDQDSGLDAQVESHRRGAEQSYRIYHDLLAKRARLTREVRRRASCRAACRAPLTARGLATRRPLQVDSAKQLEQARREIAKKLAKDKAACAAVEQELSEAEAALEEAQKRVFAAQHAKRKGAASKLALDVSPPPLPPFCSFDCSAGALATEVKVWATDTVPGAGGDERGGERAEGQQPAFEGADGRVPRAARQEQRQRLGRLCARDERRVRELLMFAPAGF